MGGRAQLIRAGIDSTGRPLPSSSIRHSTRDSISGGRKYLLAADYAHIEKVNPVWFKLNFPLFYHTDILFVLRTLRELDMLSHPDVQPAVQWLREKRTKNGVWNGSSPFRKRTRPFLADDDTPSRWITLHAASIISTVG